MRSPVPADNLDQFLKQIRARNLLKDIGDGFERGMPCGDQRVAALLMRFDAIKLTNNKRRDVTSSWELTELGISKL